ncbi:hypothetical protein K440DRAFT_642527 [Wilcoxina mikolae CBS 423.85]|nr:hypothetical protein K440DRAFT_642527 [Wilcoxina mikolae CBS 423.85]
MTTTHYDHEGLQVSPDNSPNNAPEWIPSPPVVPTTLPRHDPLPPPWPGNVKPPTYETAITTPPPPPPRKICCLRRRTFWILIIVAAVFVVIIAVVGGILGSRANKTSPPSPATSSTPTSSPTSSAAPPNPTSPLTGTSLTIPALSDNTTTNPNYFYLIYQSFNTSLYSSTIHLGGLSDTPSLLGPEFSAKPGTPLAAVAFTSGSGGTSPNGQAFRVHIFYIATNSFLTDAVLQDGTWTPGTLRTRNITPYKDSKIAASVWVDNNEPAAWVYYQADSGNIVELGEKTNEWVERTGGALDMKAVLGSGLAAAYDVDAGGQQKVRVFCETDGGLVEKEYTGSWGPQTAVADKVSGVTDVGVVVKKTGGVAEEFRVMFVEGEKVKEVGWTNGTGWGGVKEVVGGTRGKVAATRDGGGDVRLYFQSVGNGTDVRETVMGKDGSWGVTGSTIGLAESSTFKYCYKWRHEFESMSLSLSRALATEDQNYKPSPKVT